MQKERRDIESKYKWSLDKMYDDRSWEEDHGSVEPMLKDFAKYQGILTKDADTLLQALKARDEILMKIGGLYTFARMKKDEDNTVTSSAARLDKIQGLEAKARAEIAFFTPELLSAKYDKIKAFYKEQPQLVAYEFMLEELFRAEEHTLSEAEEKLISTLSPIFSASDDAYMMLSNADMDFGNVQMPNGEDRTLTHGNYGSFMYSKDRKVREQAYKKYYAEYDKHKNSIATMLSYEVKKSTILAKVKNYESSLEKALDPDNIPSSVYSNLIDTINKHLPLLHRYMEVRRKMLKLEKLRMYDIYVPLLTLENERFDYEEALDLMYDALKPLGEEYLGYVKEGVSSGWIDVYENKGKRSGAYSFGSYKSMPYILLNYDGTLRNVFTLLHEMGHSMHSLYTRKEQPFMYSRYSLFTAEVASTVNEALLSDHMIKNAKDDNEKMYLINMYMEGFRLTIFRQTMFAEFERLIHATVEEGGALTVEYLCNKYLELNRKYHGENVELDEEISLEWARIPHFYSPFYVYKYATGYSAATAISRKILKEGEPAAGSYIRFLKSGGSDHPIELLKIAGVDMSSTEPIELAMKVFEELLVEMETMLSKTGER
ncbi:MAG: oligoendopeptidase F [Peptostreptococcaceae bacterium]|nr:oligoendopeptidase F [Peptostreptococcaceae bacterium]